MLSPLAKIAACIFLILIGAVLALELHMNFLPLIEGALLIAVGLLWLLNK